MRSQRVWRRRSTVFGICTALVSGVFTGLGATAAYAVSADTTLGDTAVVSTDPANGNRYVYYDVNGTLRMSEWVKSSNTWFDSAFTQFNADITGAPSVVVDPVTDGQDVFFSSDGSLVEFAQQGSNKMWTRNFLGVATNNAPSARVDPSTNNIEVYFANTNLQLAVKTRSFDTSGAPVWGAPTALSAPNTVCGVTAYTNPSGAPEIYTPDCSFGLTEYYHTNFGWAVVKIANSMLGRPAVTTNSANGDRLVYFNNASDFFNGRGQLMEASWSPVTAQWTVTQVFASLTIVGSPAVYAAPGGGNIELYYNTSDATLNGNDLAEEQIYSQNLAAWQEPGNPFGFGNEIAGSPAVYADPSSNGQEREVYFDNLGAIDGGGQPTLDEWAWTQSLGWHLVTAI